MTQIQQTVIITGEPVRYAAGTDRWASNNGFRRRWLANGDRHAALINAARRGDINSVMAVGHCHGMRVTLTWARSLIKLARALPCDARAYEIIHRDEEATVYVPSVSWRYSGEKRVATIERVPMWTVRT